MKHVKCFMNTKNSKKKKNKIAEKNIKILKNGKVKVKKGTKIDLSNFISGDNIICSRVDGILTNEEVVVDTSEMIPTTKEFSISSVLDTGRIKTLSVPEDSATEFTVVEFTSKKRALDVFNFMNDGLVGSMLRTSILASIYKKYAKNRWEELNNDDTSQFFNVLFIPRIFVFLSDDTGKVLKNMYKINLLLIACPAQDDMSDGIDEVSDAKAVRLVIEQTLDSIVKCGIKNVILDPLGFKLFKTDKEMTFQIWKDNLSQQRNLENINTLNFSVMNEEAYILGTQVFNESV